jgi:hypothetical protein
MNGAWKLAIVGLTVYAIFVTYRLTTWIDVRGHELNNVHTWMIVVAVLVAVAIAIDIVRARQRPAPANPPSS